MNWHTKSAEEAAQELGCDVGAGLTGEEVCKKRNKYGENKLTEKPPVPLIVRFFAQLKDFMVIVLLIAAAISIVIAIYHTSLGEEGDWFEPIIIIAIVILNAILGVFQENKAESALAALKKMSAPQSRVLRGGHVQMVDSAELVPGDVVLLEAGDFVPADGRIIESASLFCDESALTGESLPVEKNGAVVLPQTAAPGDRINLVYSGSSVTNGRATVMVTSTGMATEMGKIASLIANEEEGETPLQKRLAHLGKVLGLVALAICGVIFVIGLIDKIAFMEMFMTAVSLAVAAIPEGLPAIVTIVLAMGVQRMVKRNAIIRRLPAVETLGSATVICSDKTGTLTQNRMTLMKAWPDGGKICDLSTDHWDSGTEQLIRYAALCCDGTVERSDTGELVHMGDPTETAIVAAIQKHGEKKNELEKKHPRVSELPFDSDRKLMTTVHQFNDKIISITKGAPDILLPKCVGADTARASEVNEELGRDALRVLAVAWRELGQEDQHLIESPNSGELEDGLTLMGLVGMIDPPREEVKQAMHECETAGIRTVMITGDHAVTASAIARELGILREGDLTLSGGELAVMPDSELEKNIRRYSVYARVTPSDKIRIVKAWQKAGEIVAMTGDGVNDAPALKAADIGCAMGITGTSVAKGAADVVLADDNFATIIRAVKEGRGIYDNIKKAVSFLLSCNIGEVLCVFIAMIIWAEAPLSAIHLLLINLITDSLPALALGVEPIDPDMMRRSPRRPDESIFANGLISHIAVYGTMIGVLTLIAFYIGSAAGVGSTMAFGVLALSQLAQALNTRSKHSLFRVGFTSNKYMLGAIAASVLVTLVAMIPLRGVFELSLLSGAQWMWVIGLALVPLVFSEIIKGIRAIFKN